MMTYELDFKTLPSSEQLVEEAMNPVRLTDPAILTPERLKSFYGESCGLRLLYGTEQVSENVMDLLQSLADEANLIQKMQGMQAGEKVNAVEGSHNKPIPALHTATRDFFDRRNNAPVAKEAADLAKKELDRLEAFMKKVHQEKKFKEMVMVAIGGSDLGPRAHYFALEHMLKPGYAIHFISNVDPDDAAEVMSRVKNLNETLVVVVSKSGTTLETATNEELVRERFRKQGIDPKEHFLSVTMPGTPMDNQTRYLDCFHLWEWVGGRFSTTSVCGGVMLSFAFGFDVYKEFLRGVHEMDLAALQPKLKDNVPLLSAMLGVWNHNYLGHPTFGLIPYAQPLHRYPAHIQQVEMESNGKMVDTGGHFIKHETAPIIWGEPGTNAQHSFFQMLHQGTAIVPLCLVGFKKNQRQEDLLVGGTTSQEKLLANVFAQSLALASGQNSDDNNDFFPGNRPNHILLGNQLTPYTLGNLLAVFEHRAVFQGFLWGINSFDQEGVQLGKKLATRLDKRFAARSNKDTQSEPYPIGDAYLSHLEALK